MDLINKKLEEIDLLSTIDRSVFDDCVYDMTLEEENSLLHIEDNMDLNRSESSVKKKIVFDLNESQEIETKRNRNKFRSEKEEIFAQNQLNSGLKSDKIWLNSKALNREIPDSLSEVKTNFNRKKRKSRNHLNPINDFNTNNSHKTGFADKKSKFGANMTRNSFEPDLNTDFRPKSKPIARQRRKLRENRFKQINEPLMGSYHSSGNRLNYNQMNNRYFPQVIDYNLNANQSQTINLLQTNNILNLPTDTFTGNNGLINPLLNDILLYGLNNNGLTNRLSLGDLQNQIMPQNNGLIANHSFNQNFNCYQNQNLIQNQNFNQVQGLYRNKNAIEINVINNTKHSTQSSVKTIPSISCSVNNDYSDSNKSNDNKNSNCELKAKNRFSKTKDESNGMSSSGDCFNEALAEIELGVDNEYLKKMEEMNKKRDEIKKLKEQRRYESADQRIKNVNELREKLRNNSNNHL